MKKIIRLTESDLARIVRRVIKENNTVEETFFGKMKEKNAAMVAAREWVNADTDEERDEIELKFGNHPKWTEYIGKAYDEQW